MPESPKEDQSLVDQYDIRDEASETGAAAQPTDSRPRNPDGTFATAEAPKPKHSLRLMKQAAELGVTPDEAADLSPEELRDELRDKRFERLLSQHIPQRTETQPNPGVKSDLTPADDSLGIDEAQYDEGLMKVIKGLHQRVAQLEGARRQEAEQRVELTNRAIDGVFAELNHPAYGGKKARKDLTDNSPEMLARKMLLAKAEQQGGTKAALLAAHEEMFGKRTSAKPAPETGYSPEEWAEGGVVVPSHRSGIAEPEGPEKAVRNLKRRFGEELNGDAVTVPNSADEFPG